MKLNQIKLSSEPLTLKEIEGDRISESLKLTLKSIEESIDVDLFNEITKSLSIDESFQLLQTYFFINLNQLEIEVNPAEYGYLIHWITDLFDELTTNKG